MFKNYFISALRNLKKHKTNSLLNIAGLSLGMASCILIMLYVTDERTYDKWFNDHDRIYRVSIDITGQDGTHSLYAPVSGPMAAALKQYPEVEEVTRILKPISPNTLVASGTDKKFYESGFYSVDPDFFKVFSFKRIAGNLETALDAPHTIILTQKMAAKYFGSNSGPDGALNKNLMVDGNNYKVTGVIADYPENSSLKPDFIASLKEMEKFQGFINNWHVTAFQTFFKLAPGSNAADFEKKISNIADRYVGNEIKQYKSNYRYFLQPLNSIHLYSNSRFELSKNNSITYINIFTIAGIFILLIACINFINLSTAKASQRAKEVGIRKIAGAERWQLTSQFLSESVLTAYAAVIIAWVLIYFAMPWFNVIAEKHFETTILWSPGFLIMVVLVSTLTGLLAGVYPALVLTQYNPVNVLKSQITGGSRMARFIRSGLVIVQFSISIIIIIATLVVSSQLYYIKQKDLGFNKEQVLVIHAPGANLLQDKFQVIRAELQKTPGVLSVSASGTVPGRKTINNLIQLKNDASRATGMQLMQIDDQFLKTYNIPLVAGRNLSERLSVDTSGDERSVLINEAALPFYGWKKPEDALSKEFGDGWGKVVGVVKDFNFTSLQSQISPLELYFRPRYFEYISVKLKTGDLKNSVASLEKTWQGLVSTHPFDYFFLDEDFDRQYQFENRVQHLSLFFSVISIFIACLGLFGLASYLIIQRTKEIGVRKVLGASVSGITVKLVNRFLRLVLIAIAVASPIAWYFMHEWLENFAYRISLSWWIFVEAGSAAIIIAMITVCYQAIAAAIANPVRSLRSE
jgi:putative ABC transport system permease protein